MGFKWMFAAYLICAVILKGHIKLRKKVTKSAYYYLKNVSRIRETCLLDYCNGAFTGLCKKSVRTLQLETS